MVVEILGTRTLAPVFGAGIFVWAALLTVTLCSLGVGYYAGGALIDRHPIAQALGVVLALAGAALTIAVLLAPPLLLWTLSFGPRLGSLTAATLLFAPVLTGLGMVGPIAVRLATSDVQFTGHRVGRTYAISTVGSLVGTVATVFLLIPTFETNSILLATGALILFTGAFWLRGKARTVAFLAAGLCVALTGHRAVRSLPNDLRLIDRVQGAYGLLEVIDDIERGVRLLRSDHSVIGGVFLYDRTGVFAYTHALEVLPFVRPDGHTMLQIGLGAGTLSMAMQRRGIDADVVEIDPAVARLAKKHFGYVPSGSLIIEDARTLLNRASRTYDFIVHDAFTGGVTPVHLLSQEVMQRIRHLLRPRGVLVVNFPGFADGPRAGASQALARTLRSVFSEVRVFRDGPAQPGRPTLSNLMYFASDLPMQFHVAPNARFENGACKRYMIQLPSWEVLKQRRPAPLITDARNPLMWMQAPIAAAHYRAMNELLPPQAWIPW